jgi:hypothetical protein
VIPPWLLRSQPCFKESLPAQNVRPLKTQNGAPPPLGTLEVRGKQSAFLAWFQPKESSQVVSALWSRANLKSDPFFAVPVTTKTRSLATIAPGTSSGNSIYRLPFAAQGTQIDRSPFALANLKLKRLPFAVLVPPDPL